MSLRDELLKAGLVSRDKVRESETESRKHRHEVRKDKVSAAAEAQRRADERRRQEAEAARKRERDRQLSRDREGEKERRAAEARARQLIDSHRLNEPEADIPYYVLVGGRHVRSVRVTRRQQQLLAAGRLGIACHPDNDYDFPLVDRDTALKLAECCPERLLVLHPESSAGDDD